MEPMIWFLRHGDAEDTSPDEDRRLTEKGKHQALTAGRALAALGVEPDVFLTSPKARAHETATLAGAAFGEVDVVIEERLRGGDFDAEELAAGYDEVVLVGHEPDFSRAVGALTGGRVDIKKGCLAGVDDGELRVLLRPREIEAIAES
jgi:phosphohistidine phosphatase